MSKLTDRLKLAGWTMLALGSLYVSFEALKEIPMPNYLKEDQEKTKIIIINPEKTPQISNYEYVGPLVPFYGDPLSIAMGKEQ